MYPFLTSLCLVEQYSDNFYVASLMKSLCNALLGKSDTGSEEISEFDLQRVLEAQAEEELERDSIAEIDRYRRMDEWTSSFQNLYTRAALYCQMRLMQANILELDLMQFLPYTRAGDYDLVRLDAFECLMDLDQCRTQEVLKWVLYSMSSDNSAWVRWRLHALFGRALALIAFFGFGTDEQQLADAQTNDGLIIEQEGTTDVRQADLARRQTVTGAIDALKREMSGNTALRNSLWAACNARNIGVLEISDFVDLCRILYDPITSAVVRLKYPRYWKVQNLGQVRIKTVVIAMPVLTTCRVNCAFTDPAGIARRSNRGKNPHQQSERETTRECSHQARELHSSSPNRRHLLGNPPPPVPRRSYDSPTFNHHGHPPLHLLLLRHKNLTLQAGRHLLNLPWAVVASRSN